MGWPKEVKQILDFFGLALSAAVTTLQPPTSLNTARELN